MSNIIASSTANDILHSWLLEALQDFEIFIIQAAQDEDDEAQAEAFGYEVCSQNRNLFFSTSNRGCKEEYFGHAGSSSLFYPSNIFAEHDPKRSRCTIAPDPHIVA